MWRGPRGKLGFSSDNMENIHQWDGDWLCVPGRKSSPKQAHKLHMRYFCNSHEKIIKTSTDKLELTVRAMIEATVSTTLIGGWKLFELLIPAVLRPRLRLTSIVNN